MEQIKLFSPASDVTMKFFLSESRAFKFRIKTITTKLLCFGVQLPLKSLAIYELSCLLQPQFKVYAIIRNKSFAVLMSIQPQPWEITFRCLNIDCIVERFYQKRVFVYSHIMERNKRENVLLMNLRQKSQHSQI